jgi:hypothetical protein
MWEHFFAKALQKNGAQRIRESARHSSRRRLRPILFGSQNGPMDGWKKCEPKDLCHHRRLWETNRGRRYDFQNSFAEKLS